MEPTLGMGQTVAVTLYTLAMRRGILHRNGRPVTEPYVLHDDTVVAGRLPELAEPQPASSTFIPETIRPRSS